MMPIQAMRLRSGVAAPTTYIFEKSATAQAFPASSFTHNTTSYVDLLNGSGGAVISVSLTIASGSGVWIQAGIIATNTATTLVCGVNDGTTDYDIGQAISQSTYKCASGERLITGLSAGTYTFKLRTKISGAGTITFGTAASAYIRATEVVTAAVKVISRPRAGAYNITAAANTDLLDQTGGNDYSVALTKYPLTDVVCFVHASAANTVSNATQTVVGGDATTDVDMGRNRSFTSGSVRVIAAGTNKVTGLGAGSKTLKARVRSVGGSGNQWQDGSGSPHISSFSAIEAGLGGFNANATAVGPGSNFTTTSTSYVDLLDGTAGSVISLSFTKQDNATSIAIFAVVSGVGTGTLVATLGVNDGTTDYDMGRAQFTTAHGVIVGCRALAGLAAGAYTLKLRIKTSTSTFNFNTTNMASIAAFEVTP